MVRCYQRQRIMSNKIKKIIDLRPNWTGVNLDVIILDKKDVGGERQKTPMFLFWIADLSASIVLHLLGITAMDLMPGDMLRIRSCSTYLTRGSLRIRIDGGGFIERFNQ